MLRHLPEPSPPPAVQGALIDFPQERAPEVGRAALIPLTGELLVRLCAMWRVPVPSGEYYLLGDVAGAMIARGADLAEVERTIRSRLEERHGEPAVVTLELEG